MPGPSDATTFHTYREIMSQPEAWGASLEQLAAHTGEPLTTGAPLPGLAEVVAAWQELDP